MNKQNLNDVSDNLVDIIRRRPDYFYTFAYLKRKLEIDEDLLAKAIALLRQTGYRIETRKDTHCAFKSAPDLLLRAEILHGLKTKKMGRNVHAFQSVQSTNIIARQMAETGAVEGTIVVAEEQTRGRGRLGRKWFSSNGKGIYLSIIIYPDIRPTMAPGLSIMTALALADTISDYGAPSVNIKWPNDCLINGRKTVGILTELSAEIGKVHYVIVGVGINVNQQREDFPEDIRKRATSVGAELKRKLSRVELLQNFLYQFEKDYRVYQKSGLKNLRKRIVKYSNLIGSFVSLGQKDEIISGIARDIDTEGRLILELPDGNRKAFNAGEVTVIKE
ncbi:MAG: biotin--[acetyl-CoA-carboxylase] ligase [candidate division Zixibacteria bacterium]